METMSMSTMIFPNEYGIHDRNLITVGQEFWAQAPLLRTNKKWEDNFVDAL